MSKFQIYCANFTKIGESCYKLLSNPTCLWDNTCQWILNPMVNGRCQGFNCQLSLEEPAGWTLWTPEEQEQQQQQQQQNGDNFDLLVAIVVLCVALLLVAVGFGLCYCAKKGYLGTLVISCQGFFFGLRTRTPPPTLAPAQAERGQVPALEMQLIHL